MPYVKWGSGFFIASCSFIGVYIGYHSGSTFVALASFCMGMAAGYFILAGIAAIFCSCPKCGQIWWSNISVFGPGYLTFSAELETTGIETETLKCRNCKLDLRKYLR